MARYRLRFLLQEFDLHPGETILGRSPECHVTIEDPLVSRQHARVLVRGDEATVEDLGSRNGVRVNGTPIKGPTALFDGDRVRIGTQELVFCRVAAVADALSKRTGFLRHCSRCKTPYPEEMHACPACGASDAPDEQTLSGALGDTRQNWALQLLVEVLDKALSLQREEDAERMMRRASSNVHERMAAGQAIDQTQLDALAVSASKLSLLQRTGYWLAWVCSTYASLGFCPPAAVVDAIAELPPAEQRRHRPSVEALVDALDRKASELDDAQRALLATLRLRAGHTAGGR